MRVFTEPRQKELFEEVKKYYESHNYDYGHRIDHVVRVIWWCIFLSKKEKVNLSILLPTAILHDIGKEKGGKISHAEASYNICSKFLKKYGYSEDEIKKISQATLAHSIEYHVNPKTIEEKILFDADKLDAVGSIGIHRWIYGFEKEGRYEIAVKAILKLIKVWKKRVGRLPFYTKTAKKIGPQGVTYIENMFNESKKGLKKLIKNC